MNHRVKNNLALSDDATRTELREYLSEIVRSVFSVIPERDIKIENNIESLIVPSSLAVPLGLQLITTLVRQLEGTLELQKEPCPVFTIRFSTGYDR
ncbi:MAG: hypothetical protein ACLFNZ_05380 [Spirochaetaceae bacterium]